jgi:hypothetical protein
MNKLALCLIPNMKKIARFSDSIFTSEMLVNFKVKLIEYLPVFKSRYDWIRNPFVRTDVVLSHVISKNNNKHTLIRCTEP